MYIINFHGLVFILRLRILDEVFQYQTESFFSVIKNHVTKLPTKTLLFSMFLKRFASNF